jgi:hypothetical protein
VYDSTELLYLCILVPLTLNHEKRHPIGSIEKKEDHLKENGSYEKNACPQDQQFLPPLWNNINWNIENCKSSCTEKEVVDASKRNFEINEKTDLHSVK